MKLTGISYSIRYNNKDITRDISDHLISLAYTDKVEGESDELEISVSDKENLWQNDWYPEKRAAIEAEITDQALSLPCGKFTIDEIKLSGGRADASVITISCLAASITKKLRTKKSKPHENKTLKQLAQSVASEHGLILQGSIPDIRFGRVTQNRESDLSFLNRISMLYGLIFSVRDNLLVFETEATLHNKAAVISIDKTEVIDYEFTDKSEETYKEAKVSYHNPESNELVDFSLVDEDAGITKEDILSLKTKVENKQQAEMVAGSKLSRKNKKEKTLSMSCPGNILILSGNNIEVTGFGKLSGKYQVTESKHEISREGYTTSWEGKKVDDVPVAKYKPKRRRQTATPSDVKTAAQIAGALAGQALVQATPGATVRRLGGGSRIVND